MSVTPLWDEWNLTLAIMRIFWVVGIALYASAVWLVLGGDLEARKSLGYLARSMSYLLFAGGFLAIPAFHVIFQPLHSSSGQAFVNRYIGLSVFAAVCLVILGWVSWGTYQGIYKSRLGCAISAVLFLSIAGLSWLNMWDTAYQLGFWELEVRAGLFLSPWISLAIAGSFLGCSLKGEQERGGIKVGVKFLIVLWLSIILFTAALSAVVSGFRTGGSRVSPGVPLTGVVSSFMLLGAHGILLGATVLDMSVTMALTQRKRRRQGI